MEQAESTDMAELTSDEVSVLTCGEQLKLAREARGLSLKDVVATTHQSVDLLAALEAMKTGHISPTVLRMQAKAYADFLGLPAGEIASGFSEKRSALNSSNMPSEVLRNSQMQSRRRLWPVGAAAAVIIVAGVAFWSLASGSGSPVETVATSRVVSSRVTTPRLKGPVLAMAAQELSIRARSAAWIEVRGSDGTVFRSRSMSAGEVYYPRMNAGWTVTVRDAGAFDWWLAETLVGPLGVEGTPIYSISIDEAATRGLEQLSPALADASH